MQGTEPEGAGPVPAPVPQAFVILQARRATARRADHQLDPAGAVAAVRELRTAANGRSVLLVGHDGLGLEGLDEIVIVDGGRIRREGPGEAEQAEHVRATAEGQRR